METDQPTENSGSSRSKPIHGASTRRVGGFPNHSTEPWFIVSIHYRYYIGTVLIRYNIDTVSIQYRYCTDTVSILDRCCIDTVSKLGKDGQVVARVGNDWQGMFRIGKD